jgi:hypothetical protein
MFIMLQADAVQYEDRGGDTASVAELRHHSVQVGETPAGEPYLEVAVACQPPRLRDAGLGAKARLEAVGSTPAVIRTRTSASTAPAFAARRELPFTPVPGPGGLW